MIVTIVVGSRFPPPMSPMEASILYRMGSARVDYWGMSDQGDDQ